MHKLPRYSAKRVRRDGPEAGPGHRKMLYEIEGRYYPGVTTVLSATKPPEALLARGSDADRRQLCDRYSGNPLALNLVASTIQDLFDGDIAPFLAQETVVFNGIRRLLNQQFARLSGLEQTIMTWLAIFSPDGEILASACANGTVILWHWATGQLFKTLYGHTSWVWSVAFSPDGRQLVSGSNDHCFKLWDVQTGQTLKTWQGYSN
ncbi:hypothetical protein VB780_08685 [Leptolyngbya sp. CCNP1308]|uniref:WD40 repeat domain-containing protein n=1 Tax=Leptolyngbya sp. CCNP1308 TaxID=3110255 RepID=UPI002B1FAAC8|nr:hypothetical protein [Leptolyngbya sp. CCNP1308]MEA5448638.1 hypothetical protein [Leptolyngbya sp. CCNP1308]